jgi:RNA polymerase sigma factor (sigma-70 family)
MKKIIRKILKEEILKEKINFNNLYNDLWKKMLYGVCMKYSDDINQAKDFCQNGWVKVYKNLNKFDTISNIDGLVYTIIKNSTLDDLRKIKLQYVDDEPSSGKMSGLSYDDEEEEEMNVGGISGKDIIQLSNRLSPKYKEIFDLYYLEGYKHHEIADILDINIGTSKSNLSKAKANIKKYLQK